MLRVNEWLHFDYVQVLVVVYVKKQYLRGTLVVSVIKTLCACGMVVVPLSNIQNCFVELELGQ